MSLEFLSFLSDFVFLVWFVVFVRFEVFLLLLHDGLVFGNFGAVRLFAVFARLSCLLGVFAIVLDLLDLGLVDCLGCLG